MIHKGVKRKFNDQPSIKLFASSPSSSSSSSSSHSTVNRHSTVLSIRHKTDDIIRWIRINPHLATVCVRTSKEGLRLDCGDVSKSVRIKTMTHSINHPNTEALPVTISSVTNTGGTKLQVAVCALDQQPSIQLDGEVKIQLGTIIQAIYGREYHFWIPDTAFRSDYTWNMYNGGYTNDIKEGTVMVSTFIGHIFYKSLRDTNWKRVDAWVHGQRLSIPFTTKLNLSNYMQLFELLRLLKDDIQLPKPVIETIIFSYLSIK